MIFVGIFNSFCLNLNLFNSDISFFESNGKDAHFRSPRRSAGHQHLHPQSKNCLIQLPNSHMTLLGSVNAPTIAPPAPGQTDASEDKNQVAANQVWGGDGAEDTNSPSPSSAEDTAMKNFGNDMREDLPAAASPTASAEDKKTAAWGQKYIQDSQGRFYAEFWLWSSLRSIFFASCPFCSLKVIST